MSYSESVVKSIQRGTVNVTSSSYANTATISAVVVAKSKVSYLGYTTVYTSPANVVLTNTTTVTATTVVLPSGDTGNLAFEVVEYY
jgi:hypothetical protein